MAALSALLSLAMGPINQNLLTDTGIGAGLGLVYMLSELPNSFVKRRLGIATGESTGRYKTFQLIIDKTDSLFGTCLFYYIATSVPFTYIALFFVIAFILHLSISTLLYRIKLKKNI